MISKDGGRGTDADAVIDLVTIFFLSGLLPTAHFAGPGTSEQHIHRDNSGLILFQLSLPYRCCFLAYLSTFDTRQ
jgi:hypothetical protein